MALGMWSGIAAGLKDIEDKRRYNLEREDRLQELKFKRDMFNEEMSLKYLNNIQELATDYAGYGASKKGSLLSDTSKAEQLVRMGMPTESVVKLSGMGGPALDVAIKQIESAKDPLTPKDYTYIAENILVQDPYIPEDSTVEEFIKSKGLDLSKLSEDKQAKAKEIIRRSLSTPAVASFTGTPQPGPAKISEYAAATQQLNTAITNILSQAAGKGGLDQIQIGEIGRTIEKANKEGDYGPAIKMIEDQYGVEGFIAFYKDLQDSLPNYLDPERPSAPAFTPFKRRYMELTTTTTPDTSPKPVKVLNYNPETGQFEEAND